MGGAEAGAHPAPTATACDRGSSAAAFDFRPGRGRAPKQRGRGRYRPRCGPTPETGAAANSGRRPTADRAPIQAAGGWRCVLRDRRIDGVPGFKGRHRRVELVVAGGVETVPEEEMRGAEEEQDSRGLRVPLAEPFQADDRDQNEQTSQGGNVVGVEVRIEIGSQAEEKNRQKYPGESFTREGAEKRRAAPGADGARKKKR